MTDDMILTQVWNVKGDLVANVSFTSLLPSLPSSVPLPPPPPPRLRNSPRAGKIGNKTHPLVPSCGVKNCDLNFNFKTNIKCAKNANNFL